MSQVRPIGISTRVFVAFSVMLVTFASALAFALVRLHEVESDSRLIHHSYVPLSLALSQADTDLATYDGVLGERDKSVLKRVVQAQKVIYPFAQRVANELLSARDSVDLGMLLATREGDRLFLDDSRRDITELLRQVEVFDEVSDAFRRAVVAQRWEEAYEHQARLRTIVDDMQRRLRDVTRLVRGHIGETISRTDETEQQARLTFVFLGLLAIGVSIGAMIWIRQHLKPLQDLTEGARAIAEGEYSGRVDIKRQDEVGRLAGEFNAMAEKIEARDRILRDRRDELERAYTDLVALREQEERTKAELIKKERLAAIGRMTSQVTHELRNPLSSLGLNLELLSDEVGALADPPRGQSAEEAFELLGAIEAEIERLTEITEEYLAYARLPSARLRPTPVNELLVDLARFTNEELVKRDIECVLELTDEDTTVMSDPNQVRRAVLNLIRNAADAISRGGRIKLLTRSEGDAIVTEVWDTGPGISTEDLGRIFEPFYSTKSTGTGLGLSLTSQIIEEHGGEILASSGSEGGTVFQIRLPARLEEGSPDPDPETEDAASENTESEHTESEVEDVAR